MGRRRRPSSAAFSGRRRASRAHAVDDARHEAASDCAAAGTRAGPRRWRTVVVVSRRPATGRRTAFNLAAFWRLLLGGRTSRETRARRPL